MNITAYRICDTCAPAIMNDDYTSDDLDVDRVTEFVERVGMLTHEAEVDPGGYWECDACQQVCIGTAHIMNHED